MKLLVDEMWPTTLAEELRRNGHDAVAVLERPDLVSQPDDVVVAAATSEGRAIFTENVIDFVPLATSTMASSDPFPGLVLTSNAGWPRGNPRTLGRAVRALDALMSAHPEDRALDGRIEWLVEE